MLLRSNFHFRDLNIHPHPITHAPHLVQVASHTIRPGEPPSTPLAVSAGCAEFPAVYSRVCGISICVEVSIVEAIPCGTRVVRHVDPVVVCEAGEAEGLVLGKH